MARKSLLNSIDIKSLTEQIHQDNLDAANERREKAFGTLMLAIDELAGDITESHPREIAGLNAEADFLEQLTEMLTTRRETITAGFSQPQPTVDQVASERQNRELENENRELRKEALEASNLQAKLDNVERELAELRRKNSDLASELDAERNKQKVPNPLKAANDQLKAKNDELKKENDGLKTKNTELQAENNNLKAAVAKANEIANQPLPGDEPAADEPAAPSDEPAANDQPTPASRSRKQSAVGRLGDFLPGHRRNQGEEA